MNAYLHFYIEEDDLFTPTLGFGLHFGDGLCITIMLFNINIHWGLVIERKNVPK